MTDQDEHRTTTVEKGPFCTAHCTCGWRGPARRARSQARTDAQTHTYNAPPPPTPSPSGA
ncbi:MULTISPECIES: hypothetical protein [unclassified Streptomyces]|uniref:hypothetical protein n=1 Tax=unclassified Streptomyces TaxID=2593676 RepID=UPI00074A6C8F|nr:MULTISPECIES: hypothetical protein [unclassified Streptomyces]KUL70916.1 hypothetical protein ADL34_25690 [Streptomyces sp. NRRL WC-3605]KUL72869.1 hypothetical protein ADL33_22125 [Streptomyces sp. NRRL WC-3604]